MRRDLPGRLIPKPDVLDFVNAINQGHEPRNDAHGFFYLRQDDWEKPAAGLPELPETYRGYVLDHSVEATVVRVQRGLEFEIDAGRRQGLRPGMTLIPAEKDGDLVLCELTVVSAEDGTAVARGDEDCAHLRDGERVATRSWPVAEDEAPER